MRLIKNEKGQTIEYILIAAVMVALVLFLINKVQGPAQNRVSAIGNALNSPGTGGN
jgi:Flp pilus assembly pilin Flp